MAPAQGTASIQKSTCIDKKIKIMLDKIEKISYIIQTHLEGVKK